MVYVAEPVRLRQDGRVSVVTPPAGDVVSTTDAKLHLRVDHATEDALIASLVKAAVDELDPPRGWLGRSLLSRTLQLRLDERPPESIVLPGPPVTAVSSVKYRGEDNVFVTIDPSLYFSDLTAEPALLWAGPDGWPQEMKDGPDMFRVEYVAGYASAAAIPEAIKQWIKIRVGELYRDREASVVGTIATRLEHVDRMLDNWRVRA